MGDSSLSKAAQRLRALFRRLVVILERWLDPSRSRSKQRIFGREKWRLRPLEEMSVEVERLLTGHLTTTNMLGMSHGIRAQLKSCAKNNPYCMLPSFNRALPSGDEVGAFLALDVGGSTFRVALVELAGRSGGMRIIRMKSSTIDESVKLLEGKAFFAWMGDRIKEMLDAGEEKYGYDSAPLPMGLSWSFPIDQTSVRSGRVIKMGKGFLCSNGTEGEDLGDLIMEACGKRNLNVRMDAMVNDSSAALLSRAYTVPSTRMSLILGTGTNSAIHFPIHAIGLEKFGDRHPSWFTQATHVIVNTELSMFGGGNVLPRTRWDEVLNRSHIKPDYQPLEYMSTGRYLGEIIRLILVEAVKTAGLFGGELPYCLREPYMFDTSIAAFIEQDASSSLSSSSSYLQKEHDFHFTPSPEDLAFMKRVCVAVSKRAAAYLAVAIHSLWCLRNETELPLIATTTVSPTSSTSTEDLHDPNEISSIPQDLTIACDGTVINKYPGFRPQCQRYLNKLTLSATSTSSEPAADALEALQSKQVVTSVTETPSILLDPAPESAIFGAAVAVAVAGAESRLSGGTPA